jgi:hypothetical protein
MASAVLMAQLHLVHSLNLDWFRFSEVVKAHDIFQKV